MSGETPSPGKILPRFHKYLQICCRNTTVSIRDGIRFSIHSIRFPHSKNTIQGRQPPTPKQRSASTSKTHPGTATPPNNMQEDDELTLTLEDVLCMASSLIDCCIFFNKNQIELYLTNVVAQFICRSAAGSSQPLRPPSPINDRPSNKE